jgi:hypothetical protein
MAELINSSLDFSSFVLKESRRLTIAFFKGNNETIVSPGETT